MSETGDFHPLRNEFIGESPIDSVRLIRAVKVDPRFLCPDFLIPTNHGRGPNGMEPSKWTFLTTFDPHFFACGRLFEVIFMFLNPLRWQAAFGRVRHQWYCRSAARSIALRWDTEILITKCNWWAHNSVFQVPKESNSAHAARTHLQKCSGFSTGASCSAPASQLKRFHCFTRVSGP